MRSSTPRTRRSSGRRRLRAIDGREGRRSSPSAPARGRATGDAKATGRRRLPARYVVHAVGRSARGMTPASRCLLGVRVSRAPRSQPSSSAGPSPSPPSDRHATATHRSSAAPIAVGSALRLEDRIRRDPFRLSRRGCREFAAAQASGAHGIDRPRRVSLTYSRNGGGRDGVLPSSQLSKRRRMGALVSSASGAGPVHRPAQGPPVVAAAGGAHVGRGREANGRAIQLAGIATERCCRTPVLSAEAGIAQATTRGRSAHVGDARRLLSGAAATRRARAARATGVRSRSPRSSAPARWRFRPISCGIYGYPPERAAPGRGRHAAAPDRAVRRDPLRLSRRDSRDGRWLPRMLRRHAQRRRATIATIPRPVDRTRPGELLVAALLVARCRPRRVPRPFISCTGLTTKKNTAAPDRDELDTSVMNDAVVETDSSRVNVRSRKLGFPRILPMIGMMRSRSTQRG